LQQQPKLILGVDPGTQMMGYSLLKVTGKQLAVIEMNVIRLTKIKDMFERLGMINEAMVKVIRDHKPTEMAIEAPFFGKNVQSMLKLGRAQGVAIGIAMEKGLPVAEYSPKKVKQSITGNGNADKEQVWKMLKTIIKIDIPFETYDATDALAVAVCHHFQGHAGPQGGKKGKGGWESFLKENKHRIKM
jgi:crossover junction endodeoxyribonuclease RuvC